jgi:hypothetical protein
MRAIDDSDNNGCIALDSFLINKLFILWLIELKLRFKYILRTFDRIIFGTEMKDIPSWTSSTNLDIKIKNLFLY